MKMKHVIIPLFVILLLTMACAIGYEGLQISDDPETVNILDMTAIAENAQPSTAQQPVSTPEPTSRPVLPAEPEAQTEPDTETAGPKEYSVAATNFNCTCQENGNVTIEFKIKGDQLEYPNGGGGVDVYEKIGENAYKRSWMGYYILSSGEGENATETKVDEERSVVIILNDSGYVMEHYQGTSSSPCCFYTFTNKK
jgi:hypothetical protein